MMDEANSKQRPAIVSLRMVNFKNFVDQTLRLGPFTVVVGTNASGKSNIRDAFRFLHGIGRGYTLMEVVGGKWGAGGQREWDPIRGAAMEVARLADPVSRRVPSTFAFHVGVKSGASPVSYSIEVGFNPDPLGFQVVYEALRSGSRTLYETMPARDAAHWVRCGDRQIGLSRTQPALTQLDTRSKAWPKGVVSEVAELGLREALADMRFWDPSPELMRMGAFPGTPLGDRGEGLPAVLEDICTDARRQTVLASWIQELTPMDVSSFEFPHDPRGLVHLKLCESNGRMVSADSASDGTLRFLAMLAVLLGKDPPGLCFFEEVDAGIHAARQSLLLELIETQAAKRGIQVVTTTHSPELLTYANDSTFEHISVVCRPEHAHDAVIRPVAKLPNARELRVSGGGLGSLLSEGWMESAVAFTEDDEEEDNS